MRRCIGLWETAWWVAIGMTFNLKPSTPVWQATDNVIGPSRLDDDVWHHGQISRASRDRAVDVAVRCIISRTLHHIKQAVATQLRPSSTWSRALLYVTCNVRCSSRGYHYEGGGTIILPLTYQVVFGLSVLKMSRIFPIKRAQYDTRSSV